LDGLQYLDDEASIIFTLSCQNSDYGGISKFQNESPDPLHSFMSLSGLSLMKYKDLLEIDETIGITLNSLNYKN
jgi:prenyltransferase beta subunit